MSNLNFSHVKVCYLTRQGQPYATFEDAVCASLGLTKEPRYVYLCKTCGYSEFLSAQDSGVTGFPSKPIIAFPCPHCNEEGDQR